MENSHFLEEGPQTRFTDLVYEHAEEAGNTVMKDQKVATLLNPLLAIHKTCKYISQLNRVKGFIEKPQTREEDANHRLKEKLSRKRSLNQVLGKGYFPTCSDIGLLFRGLMAVQGYPTAFVETFHEDYLFSRDFHGHVFGRVFDGDKEYIVNPKPNPIIVEDEADIFPYVIFREGLDSWDIGIYGYDDMHRLRREHLPELLDRYEASLKINFERRMSRLQELREGIADKNKA